MSCLDACILMVAFGLSLIYELYSGKTRRCSGRGIVDRRRPGRKRVESFGRNQSHSQHGIAIDRFCRVVCATSAPSMPSIYCSMLRMFCARTRLTGTTAPSVIRTSSREFSMVSIRST